MASHGIFATTINCMDGRAVEATASWMKDKFHLDHVDAITEPGMDAYIASMDQTASALLKKKLEISIGHHGSRIITVGGHEDCAGNPVDEGRHKEDIARGVQVVKKMIADLKPDAPIQVLGLYIFLEKDSLTWKVEQI
ncbi:MAG: hypothetical protein A3C13_03975 [Candidatus Lloydbacteria bacterium RIFCSPHIGHO2_02_FULL_50_11]|nr:MAG: hypothetical protein A3C13_03975 [Candidatus Lloydbacteria bacterium RIFCSPHIGHO2_02_FULL_50_11]